MTEYRPIAAISLADLEGIRLLLRGGSVIDWHRLNFANEKEGRAFVRAQEVDYDSPVDRARMESVKMAAIQYLRRHFEFPIPKPVAKKDLLGLVMLASSKGHRQLCACAILKVMHIIHHLDARELLFVLPISDEEVFHLVEQKVYSVMGAALANDVPIVEFIGGRKNKDSLYTKLLSKPDSTAAQIYDKVRFRVVTRTRDDVLPMLRHLEQHVFPFSFVIPGQSTNTLVPFHRSCNEREELRRHLPHLQLPLDMEDELTQIDNRFTASSYRVVHFVVDMPVRVPDTFLNKAPPAAKPLGRVIFVQTEFQVLDEVSDRDNEDGDASHAAYKSRQRLAVIRRLKVGRS